MDSLLNRYRNVTVLVLAIMAQLVLLAYQVKTGNDVRLIRVWAVTAVMPLARTLEGVRSGVATFAGSYLTRPLWLVEDLPGCGIHGQLSDAARHTAAESGDAGRTGQAQNGEPVPAQ